MREVQPQLQFSFLETNIVPMELDIIFVLFKPRAHGEVESVLKESLVPVPGPVEAFATCQCHK